MSVAVGFLAMSLAYPPPPPAAAASDPCYLVGTMSGVGRLTITDLADPDPATNETIVGATGADDLGPIAIQPSTGIIFAARPNRIGTIDPSTGVYTSVGGAIGTAKGALGIISVDPLVGLAFDPITEDLWAVQRMDGAPDLLLRLEPTGTSVVKDTFGPGMDYVEIVSDKSTQIDFFGLAFDAGGVLHSVGFDGGSQYELHTIDPSDGTAVAAPGAVPDTADLAFDTAGRLWGIGPTGTLHELHDAAPTRTVDDLSGYTGIVCPPPAPPNQSPVFDQDLADRSDREGATIAVSAAATDPEGDTITYSAAGLPSGITIDETTGLISGTVALTAAASSPWFVSITATDTSGNDAVDTFTWEVVINQPPGIVTPADRTLAEAGSLWVTVWASDPDLDPVTVTVSGLPGWATYTQTWASPGLTTGVITGSPGYDDAGFSTITITATDGVLTDEVAFDITVTNTNRAPALTNPGAQTTLELAPFTVVITASDPDGDPIALSGTGIPGWASLVDNGDGTATLAGTPGASDAATSTVTIAADDGQLTDEATFDLTVTNTNEPPVLTDPGPQSASEGSPFSLGLSATDPDGTAPSFTATGLPPWAELVDGEDGTATIAGTPGYDDAGVSSVTVTVSDGLLDDEATFDLAVADVNRDPVLDPIADQIVTEGAPFTLMVSATDPDGDPVSLGAGGLPSWAGFFDNGDGSAVISGTPGFADSGATTVTITADDGAGSAASDFTITVTEVNRPPVLDPVGDRTVDEQTLVSFTATASDPDGNTTTFTLTGTVPPGAAITPGGAFTWTPTEAQGPGTYTFDVVVTDNGTPTLTDIETITITVTEVNRSPILDPVGHRTVDEQTLVSFTATASDPDGNTTTFTLTGTVPPGAAITPGGAFTWTPTEAQGPGTYTFDVVATDNGTPTLTDIETITITVTETNQAPTVANPGNQTNAEADTVSLTVTATDPDLPTNTITWSASGLPPGLAITPATGHITGTITPTAAAGSPYTATVTATDNGTPTLTDTTALTWTVVSGGGLVVSKASDGGGWVLPGDTITYSITVTNTDAVTHTGVTVSDPPPVGTSHLDTTFIAPVESSVRDDFDVASYSNDDGSTVWSGPWIETGDDGSPSGGDILITDDAAAGVQLALDIGKVTRSVERAADLTDATSAQLSFDYWVYHLSHGGEDVYIEVWDGSSWTTLETFVLLPASSSWLSWSRDISAFANASTKVRFRTGTNGTAPWGMNIDNVDITWWKDGTATPGSAPTAASGVTLTPGASVAITYRVMADDPLSVSQITNVASATSDQQAAASQASVTDSALNQTPVLGPVGALSGDEQTLISFTATATDPDVPAGLTFTLEDAAGSVPPGAAITSGGVFSWTPTEVQGPGVYSFDVVVTDNTALQDRETITVTVNETNQAPVLGSIGDRTIGEESLLSFVASASDSDLPANGLAYSLVGAPAGSSMNPVSGLFDWIPTEAQGPGTYTFDVVVTDNGTPTLTDIETITITVTETNQAPTVANPGNQTNAEADTVSLTVTATDPDLPTNTITWSASGLPPGLAITPATGHITGTITPTAAAGSPYTATVTATDNGTPTLTDTTAFTWTVTDTNRPPILDPVGHRTVDEQTLVSFTATASDPDGNTTTFTLTGTVPPGAAITPGGAFTWTPTETQGPGTHTFDVVATDNGTPTLTNIETITITVTETNQAPTVANPGNQTNAEADTVSLTVTATDPDLPTNTITWSASGLPPGLAITPATGHITGTITPTAAAGSPYTATVTATDNGTPTLTDTTAFTWTVTDTNRPPILDPVGHRTVDEQTLVSFTATASDPDGNTTTFTLTGTVPPGAAITPGGAFTWTPTETQGPGTYTFDVVATDNGTPTLTNIETITITVTETNQAPVLIAPASMAGTEGVPFTHSMTATDPDLPTNTITWSTIGLPRWATLTSVVGTATLSGTPGYTDAGTATITVRASDGSATTTAIVEIVITNTNRAPVLGYEDSAIVMVGDAWETVVTATDPDGSAPNLSVSGLPAWAEFIPSPGGGTISGTPSTDDIGTSIVHLLASDAMLTVIGEMEVTVERPDRPPSITWTMPPAVAEGFPIEPFTIVVSDPDGDPVTFQIDGLPTWARLDTSPAGATITGTPGFDAAGDATIVVVAQARGVTTRESLIISVSDTNRPPMVQSLSRTTPENRAIDVSLAAATSDPDGDVVTVSGVGSADHGNVTMVDEMTIRYEPDPGYVGTDAVEYTVTDPSGAQATARLTIEIRSESYAAFVSKSETGMLIESMVPATADGVEVTGVRSLSPTEGLRVAFSAATETIQSQILPTLVLGIVMAWLLVLGVGRRDKEEDEDPDQLSTFTPRQKAT